MSNSKYHVSPDQAKITVQEHDCTAISINEKVILINHQGLITKTGTIHECFSLANKMGLRVQNTTSPRGKEILRLAWHQKSITKKQFDEFTK